MVPTFLQQPDLVGDIPWQARTRQARSVKKGAPTHTNTRVESDALTPTSLVVLSLSWLKLFELVLASRGERTFLLHPSQTTHHASHWLASFRHTVGVVHSAPESAPAVGTLAHAAVGFLAASVPIAHLENPEDEDPKTIAAGSQQRPPPDARRSSVSCNCPCAPFGGSNRHSRYLFRGGIVFGSKMWRQSCACRREGGFHHKIRRKVLETICGRRGPRQGCYQFTGAMPSWQKASAIWRISGWRRERRPRWCRTQVRRRFHIPHTRQFKSPRR